MKLEFLGHDERYIVEQSLMTLFPLEKPTYDAVQPGDEAWCRLTAAETAADCQGTAELHYHGSVAQAAGSAPRRGKANAAPLGDAHRRPTRQAHHTGVDGGQDPGGSQAGTEGALFRP